MRGPLAILTASSQSHPFEERKCRVGPEQEPLKVGRSVARLKPTNDNAIFDCKVLSRNHAILWYKDGCFWLKDTKSSNGTFVNNERLAVTGEDSEPKQLFTGDIIQFGVEIVENANKVAHGCIFAMLRLYDENGEEVENTGGTLGKTTDGLGVASLMTSHQLFQMQQYLKEALHKGTIYDQKLDMLDQMLEQLESNSKTTWSVAVNEDRLLSRIATLEEQLALYSRNAHTDKVKIDMDNLIMDKARFEAASKEGLRRALEDRAETQLRLAETERSLVNTEEECNTLRKRMLAYEERLSTMLDAFEDLQSQKEADAPESQFQLVDAVIMIGSLLEEGIFSESEHETLKKLTAKLNTMYYTEIPPTNFEAEPEKEQSQESETRVSDFESEEMEQNRQTLENTLRENLALTERISILERDLSEANARLDVKENEPVEDPTVKIEIPKATIEKSTSPFKERSPEKSNMRTDENEQKNDMSSVAKEFIECECKTPPPSGIVLPRVDATALLLSLLPLITLPFMFFYLIFMKFGSKFKNE